MTSTIKLTGCQVEALSAAHLASDGWLQRGCCRIWGVAPMAIRAMVRRGYLEMHPRQAKARLTEKGRALIKADPERFGPSVKRRS
jgi:hypothetical protein